MSRKRVVECELISASFWKCSEEERGWLSAYVLINAHSVRCYKQKSNISLSSHLQIWPKLAAISTSEVSCICKISVKFCWGVRLYKRVIQVFGKLELTLGKPAQAPSWQPCCSGTFPGSRKWRFPALCFESAPARHLVQGSHCQSSHVWNRRQ